MTQNIDKTIPVLLASNLLWNERSWFPVMQKLLKAHPVINFHWSGLIKNVFIAPVEILIPKNKPFIYIAFDYGNDRTTHFKELISLN